MRDRFASFWSYPLASGGAIQLAFAKPYPWLPRELALLEAVAARCEEAIERRCASRRSVAWKRRHTRRKSRSGGGLAANCTTRPGSRCCCCGCSWKCWSGRAGRFAPELAEARGIAERTVVELRRIMAALSPAVLERLGLESGAASTGGAFREDLHRPRCGCASAGMRARVPMEMQEVIYRVAQESLQNVAKHSRATHVNLSLESADKSIRLSVSDNGAGFSAETAAEPADVVRTGGDAGARGASWAAALAVRSAPRKGATVTLELPGTRTAVAGKCQRFAYF